ncbi:MAG: hypothetical protein JKY55_14415 [Aliivibrio sp.]|uniref:hypothetical protein n=1 Tax=Aliivibrio sp. TaxID=1872443 RepID=UPI001A5473F5|nr:hypothetical protein [Aliivibrio sp.]
MNRLIGLLLFATLSLPIQANSCKVEGYTIGFFNGVATTLKQAINGRKKIESTLNVNQYNGQDIDYQLFYNDSYIDEGMLNVLGDFAETFDQRTSELEQRTFERWEAFWDIVNGRTNSSIINLIDSLISGFLDFVHDVISLGLNEDIKLFLEDLATLSTSTPNTEEVRKRHQLINDSLAWSGKKLIYIAHSQGNLWVNESFQSILDQQGYDASNIKTIHIAPASPTVNGDYILSTNDLVINGLKLTGYDSIKESNITIPKKDLAGHSLIDVYLTDPNSIAMIKTFVNNALSDLQKPEINDYLYQFEFIANPAFIQTHEKEVAIIADQTDNINVLNPFELKPCPAYHYCSFIIHSKYIVDEWDSDEFTVNTFNAPYPISIENTYTITQCHNLTDSSYLISFVSKLSDQTRSPVKYQLRITDRFNMLHEDIEKGQSSDGYNSGNHASFWRIEQSSRVLSDSERKYLTNNNLVVPKSLWAGFYADYDTGL